MKAIHEIPAVIASRERYATLTRQREAIAARIQKIEGAIAGNDEADSPDPVAVALGEVAEPLTAADELARLRKQYAMIVKALDLQGARVVEAESIASAAANAEAQPEHVKACQEVLKAAAGLTAALEAERAIRAGLLNAGYACHLESVADAFAIPEAATKNLEHLVAVSTAKPAGKPVTGRALVDLPQHKVFAGEPVILAPDEAARLHRAGAFDPGATGETVAGAGVATGDIDGLKAKKGARLRLLPEMAERLVLNRLFRPDTALHGSGGAILE